MDNLDKKIQITELLLIYKDLLSESQSKFLTDYYCYDLSFGEIAENNQISRSAVEDATKKGCKKLLDLESKLHLLEKKRNIIKILNEMIENKDFDEEKINEIKEQL